MANWIPGYPPTDVPCWLKHETTIKVRDIASKQIRIELVEMHSNKEFFYMGWDCGFKIPKENIIGYIVIPKPK